MRLIVKDDCLDIIKQAQDESVVYRECSRDIGDKSGVTFGLGREMALENIKHIVENMPTIEVIPIVCLQKLVNEWQNDGDDYVMNCAEQLYHLIEEWEEL